jgi:hypothetical protein
MPLLALNEARTSFSRLAWPRNVVSLPSYGWQRWQQGERRWKRAVGSRELGGPSGWASGTQFDARVLDRSPGESTAVTGSDDLEAPTDPQPRCARREPRSDQQHIGIERGLMVGEVGPDNHHPSIESKAALYREIQFGRV